MIHIDKKMKSGNISQKAVRACILWRKFVCLPQIDNLKMKTTSKSEDGFKNEDVLKNEDNLNNEGGHKIRIPSKTFIYTFI